MNEKEEMIRDFVYALSERPGYVTENCIYPEIKGERINIWLFGDYCVSINASAEFDDGIKTDEGLAWGKQDIKYASDIFDNRDEIIKLAGLTHLKDYS